MRLNHLKNKIKQNYKEHIAIALFVLIFFVTHIPRLNNDEMNPDAINWHWRAEQYIDAIKSKDFMRSYQHYHPGVTITFIVGVPVEILKRTETPRVLYNRATYEAFHFVAKYLLVMVLLVLTMTLLYSLSRIMGFWTAYAGIILLSLEPYFLGNSRLLHMDVLLALFIINALVASYIGYRYNSYKFIIASALFLGFGFWTKNVTILAIAYIACASIVFAVLRYIPIKKVFASILIIVTAFFLVGYSILPALWVSPDKVFKKIYQKSKMVVDQGHEERFFGQNVMDPGPLYYPLVLMFKLSPYALVTFLASLFYFTYFLIRNHLKVFKSKELFFYYLLAFGVGYFLAITIAQKKIDRYLVPLYPIIFIFIAHYSNLIFKSLKSTNVQKVLLTLVVLIYMHPLISYFPYYFVYNSPLLGGTPGAEKVVGQKSFGVGIFEVKEFLLKNYGFVPVGFVDDKPMSAIYPNSMLFNARLTGPGSYDVLVLDSDDIAPKKTQGHFIYDKSIKIGGINYWNFYVKTNKENK